MLYRMNFRSDRIKIIVILICIMVTAFTLSRYAVLIGHLLRIRYNGWFELAMIIGMILFQFPFLRKRSTALKLEYYFCMLLVSLMGSLLIWPLLLLNHFFPYGDIMNIGWFFTVVAIMFFTHKKVVSRLHLPNFLSYTWMGYRLIVLLLII